jgi:biopolymer transport protein ExbD
MAEINTASADTHKAGVRRSKKLSTKVDLTPMVDLGFLLITFFIFSSVLKEPMSTRLIMPDDRTKDSTVTGNSSSLTAVLLPENKVFYYEGRLEDAIKGGTYGVTTFSMSDGIGQIIRNKQSAMDKMKKGYRKELVLMFKPTPDSNYGNVVDILDEVEINMISHYALMGISDNEKAIIEAKMKSL